MTQDALSVGGGGRPRAGGANHSFPTRVGLAVLAVAVAATAAACSGTSDASTGTSTAEPTGQVARGGGLVDPSTDAAALQTNFVNIVKNVRPSVVEIATDSGLGSGVVFDANGSIVTNAHVVGTSTQFQVTLSDGRTLGATLVGVYQPDDLAVIKVSGSDMPTPATFADSSKVQAGDVVLAIGNPLGLSSSVTEGIVSDTGRTVDEGDGVVLPSTIQTSAPINPGNSGGALVGLDGSVIGIPTLGANDPQDGGRAAPGIGFAIPSNKVKLIADQLVQTGNVTNSGRAALGIEGTTATDRAGNPVGVLVRTTVPNQAAADAGIAVGSIITAVAGQPTPDADSLAEVLAGLSPKTRVPVSLVLGTAAGQTVDVVLTDLSSVSAS